MIEHDQWKLKHNETAELERAAYLAELLGLRDAHNEAIYKAWKLYEAAGECTFILHAESWLTRPQECVCISMIERVYKFAVLLKFVKDNKHAHCFAVPRETWELVTPEEAAFVEREVDECRGRAKR